ncbi:hypothetical protein BDF14DRAFT_1796872 [Spinellus fusiger]|nr:hypothetical protein BDF14DRAFT_1796872 [Spinellus fusiger]
MSNLFIPMLIFYDPLTNTPTYKSVTTSLTANSEASTYFWDSVLFLGVLLCLWYKNRQKEKSKIHNTVIVPEKDKMSVLEEAYQTTPLPQPVEDAESWSRRVLRLLTSIAPDRSVFSKPARTSSKSSRRTQHTHASSSTSGTRVPSPPKINQPLPFIHLILFNKNQVTKSTDFCMLHVLFIY